MERRLDAELSLTAAAFGRGFLSGAEGEGPMLETGDRRGGPTIVAVEQVSQVES